MDGHVSGLLRYTERKRCAPQVLALCKYKRVDFAPEQRVLFGEVAERLKAAVLKTVDPQGSGGSNPSLSAI